MKELVGYTEFFRALTTQAQGLDAFTADTKAVRMKYKETDPHPILEIDGRSIKVSSEWAIKQICKLMNVTPKFFSTSPCSLFEESFNTHIIQAGDKDEKMVFLVKQQGPDVVLRSIVSEDFFQITNLEVFKTLSNIMGEDNIEGVDLLSKSLDSMDPETEYLVVSTVENTISGIIFKEGIYVKMSELGSIDLHMTPVFYNVADNSFIPFLANGKVSVKISHISPPNGTIIPGIQQGIQDFSINLSSMVDKISGKFEEEISDEAVMQLLERWKFHRDLPKKVIKSATADYLNLDEDDDDGDATLKDDIVNFGGVAQLVLRCAAESSPKDFVKASAFISNQCEPIE